MAYFSSFRYYAVHEGMRSECKARPHLTAYLHTALHHIQLSEDKSMGRKGGIHNFRLRSDPQKDYYYILLMAVIILYRPKMKLNSIVYSLLFNVITARYVIL